MTDDDYDKRIVEIFKGIKTKPGGGYADCKIYHINRYIFDESNRFFDESYGKIAKRIEQFKDELGVKGEYFCIIDGKLDGVPLTSEQYALFEKRAADFNMLVKYANDAALARYASEWKDSEAYRTV